MADSFELESKLYTILVRQNPRLVGRTLEELALGRDFGVSVLTVEKELHFDADPMDRRERRRRRMSERVRQLQPGREVPGPETQLQGHDILIVKATEEAIQRAADAFEARVDPVQVGDEELAEVLLSHEVGVAEVLLTPRSPYIGQTVAQGQFAEKFHVQVLSVRRGDRRVQDTQVKLAFGDALLVRGTWEALAVLRRERRNFVVLGDPEAMSRQVVELSWPAIVAVAALAGMIALMVSGLVPTVMAALLAAAVMVLGRCLTMAQAYRAISWQSVVLIAAMIPMSIALEVTGGADFVAAGLVNTLGSLGPLALMAGVFLLTTAFSQVINNTATAVLVAPIVMKAAGELGLSPYPLLMAVAVSASTAFMTPIGTTTNLMVMTPGSYRFTDYARVGGPLVLFFLVVTLALVPLIWPF